MRVAGDEAGSCLPKDIPSSRIAGEAHEFIETAALQQGRMSRATSVRRPYRLETGGARIDDRPHGVRRQPRLVTQCDHDRIGSPVDGGLHAGTQARSLPGSPVAADHDLGRRQVCTITDEVGSRPENH